MKGPDYDHSRNLHSVEGAKRALQILFADAPPNSVLDVGCGTGTWLRAALDLGVPEVFGVDGASIDRDVLLIPHEAFRIEELSIPLNLEKKFELVICVEVAEHLDAMSARSLIDTLVRHSDRILFSAAAPQQKGQHHINCRWPNYWQNLFNQRNYVCDDKFRWRIWEETEIEPWYRQNVFMAVHAPLSAGSEPRIKSVIHPDMISAKAYEFFDLAGETRERQIEAGSKQWWWYLTVAPLALTAKAKRKLGLAR